MTRGHEDWLEVIHHSGQTLVCPVAVAILPANQHSGYYWSLASTLPAWLLSHVWLFATLWGIGH